MTTAQCIFFPVRPSTRLELQPIGRLQLGLPIGLLLAYVDTGLWSSLPITYSKSRGQHRLYEKQPMMGGSKLEQVKWGSSKPVKAENDSSITERASSQDT